MFEYTISSLFDSQRLVAFADEIMHNRNGISILALSRELQENCGSEFSTMTARDWYVVTREYVQRQTMRYDIRDDEEVTWMMAAESGEFAPMMVTD